MLASQLGGNETAGGEMKETGTVHWKSPNTGASNESGFSGIPGGYLSIPYGYLPGTFFSMGELGIWWLFTPAPYDCCSMVLELSYTNQGLAFNQMGRYDYLPVRCIMDE
jgi:uncharacterized protein (TIGR02145 family)